MDGISTKKKSVDELKQMVIQRAFDVTDSIIAGDWNIPKPMVLALNLLFDAVSDYAREANINVASSVSFDYKEFRDLYWEDLKNKLRDV